MKKAIYKQWIKLAYRVGQPLWRRFGVRWLHRPDLSLKKLESFAKKMNRPQKNDSVLAFCCMQDLYQHDVIASALDLMQRLGHPLKVDKRQPCCGAIFERLIHGGEESVKYRQENAHAITLQQKTIQTFLKWLRPQTSFLAKGCHAFISDYTSHAIDLYQSIGQLLTEKKIMLNLPEAMEVFYQPYCRTKDESQDFAWQILKQINGLQLRRLSHPRACCGGYCGETLLHPNEVSAISAQKIESLPEGATVIVTSPDCWVAFQSSRLEKKLNIQYPTQIIAKAELFSIKF